MSTNRNIAFEFNDDSDAWAVLSRAGFKCDRGHIRRPSPDCVVTAVESAAIRYLCEEWDYAYEG